MSLPFGLKGMPFMVFLPQVDIVACTLRICSQICLLLWSVSYLRAGTVSYPSLKMFML